MICPRGSLFHETSDIMLANVTDEQYSRNNLQKAGYIEELQRKAHSETRDNNVPSSHLMPLFSVQDHNISNSVLLLKRAKSMHEMGLEPMLFRTTNLLFTC
jgi:hypothetical protein